MIIGKTIDTFLRNYYRNWSGNAQIELRINRNLDKHYIAFHYMKLFSSNLKVPIVSSHCDNQRVNRRFNARCVIKDSMRGNWNDAIATGAGPNAVGYARRSGWPDVPKRRWRIEIFEDSIIAGAPSDLPFTVDPITLDVFMQMGRNTGVSVKNVVRA